MRLIITGGGTGGHLFPGIAVATGMQQRLPGTEVLFVGTSRKMDSDALAEYDFARATIHCMGLKGMGLAARLRSLFQLPAAVFESIGIIRKFQPDLVFGVGGYVTGPVLLAAKMSRVPICIHEQNSVPGLANRIAGKIADRICISLPCQPSFQRHKTVQTGNPVRLAIRQAAARRKQINENPQVLLVLGGSQGAHRLNELVVEAVSHLSAADKALVRIIHQTGNTDREMVEQEYRRLGLHVEVGAFFQDMAACYEQADLVVSRAGATTLAELAVMGLPALLVPFPFAADNHQETNALYYQDGGGAVMLTESELTSSCLAKQITTRLHNREELHTMATNMKKMGRPEATDHILDQCIALVSQRISGRV